MPNGRPTDKQRQGRLGEDAALAHLLARGLVLVQRNFRCKGGEIDLIMRERGDLVFVEVRQRAGASHGGAAASVTPAKRKRLVLAAQVYLLGLKTLPPCRFDVVAIDAGALSWLRNAIDT
ncbi:putative endonuclease [Janthinobacterium sp. CG_23.3]|uniref:YraN family protein n=1 Tax=unclassified Janthinobacterium TaxID=2610881 RepID=UPI002DFE5E2F|nr:putative endonuclease [Janthinobacterium sp. CG_S6]